jgi:DNA polymerase-3 subunit delta'
MAFSDIVGHQRQLETLRVGLMNGRLHHAYLFWGPEGIGKRTTAMAFAMALHCEDGPPSDSCGQCRSCVSIAGGSHPDVHRVELKSQKKEISVEQVRQLQHHLSLRSLSGKGKVVIVDPAHLLNYHAQNSLLKTLEEPSEGSTIVLISKSRGGLLPTILSRCFQLAFVAPSSELVAELLVRKKGLSADQARLLAAVSMGSPGEALASDPALYLERRHAWLERLSALAPGDYRAVLELAGDAAGDREQALYFLRCMEAWYRDVLMVQITGSSDRIRNLDMDEKIRRRADLSTPERTVSILEEIDRAVREIQRNYNSRMALEHLLMRTGRAIG